MRLHHPGLRPPGDTAQPDRIHLGAGVGIRPDRRGRSPRFSHNLQDRRRIRGQALGRRAPRQHSGKHKYPHTRSDAGRRAGVDRIEGHAICHFRPSRGFLRRAPRPGSRQAPGGCHRRPAPPVSRADVDVRQTRRHDPALPRVDPRRTRPNRPHRQLGGTADSGRRPDHSVEARRRQHVRLPHRRPGRRVHARHRVRFHRAAGKRGLLVRRFHHPRTRGGELESAPALSPGLAARRYPVPGHPEGPKRLALRDRPAHTKGKRRRDRVSARLRHHPDRFAGLGRRALQDLRPGQRTGRASTTCTWPPTATAPWKRRPK